jgi:integrase
MAAFAGLRVGELLALRWADVDLERARIDVRNAVVGVPYSAIRPPSRWHRSRCLDIGPDLVALLREHRDRQHAERAEWGAHYRNRDLVVCRENGELLHPRSLSRAFAQVAERAALRSVGIFTLRRTRAASAASRALLQ